MPRTRTRWTVAVAVAVTLAVGAVVAPGAAGAKPKPKKISSVSAFALPSAKHCVRGRTLTLRVRRLARIHWVSAKVKLDGKRFKVVTRARVGRPIRLSGLPAGRFTLTITATATDGRSVSVRRTYTACAPTRQPQPEPTPMPTPTPTPLGVAPGSYSGLSPQGYVFSFYVAADRAHIQDVAIPTGLGCTPTRNLSDHIGIASVAIAADGSFSAAATQDGVLFGAPAHFTYTFSGHFEGTGVSGSFHEDVAFDDGTAYSCTTNTQSWSATRDTQGTQTVGLPAGSYSGLSPQGYVFSFYVAADGAHLQDVAIPTGLGCTPTLNLSDHVRIASIAIAADGSFSGSATQDGVLAGHAAHFMYTFSGHAHGTTASGVARVAGTFREDIAYDDGTARSCTTNAQNWAATRDTQGTPTTTLPDGTYTGLSPQGYVFSFHVSGAHITDVSVPTSLGCAPTKLVSDHVVISDVSIAGDGSFAITAEADGLVDNAPVHLTYTFSGHSHGTTGAGVARAGGTYREDVDYTDHSFSCTTNDQSWAATHT